MFEQQVQRKRDLTAVFTKQCSQEIEDRKRIQQLISRDPINGVSPAQSEGGLPSYGADVLVLKVESMQAQLNEQVMSL